MHNSPVVTSAKSFNLTSMAFLIVTFLIDIADALQTPAPSVFLTDEVHARPVMVGSFFTGGAVVGTLMSQFLAGRSDKHGSRKSLIVFRCPLGVPAYTLSAWDRNCFILPFVGVLLSSLDSTANPQIFAFVREHADEIGREAVMFNPSLRAQVSLARVIGPPSAYVLATGFNPTVTYLSAAVALIVCGVMVWLFLPSMRREFPLATGTVEALCRNRCNTLLLFIIYTLMWDSNSLYITNIPLLIINELHLPKKLIGVMMGIVAGLEIPTMLIAGHFARRLGKRFLICVAAVGSVYFYTGILMAHSPIILLGLWLLSIIFIGILDGIRILYFQDLMSGQAGSATTLYINTSHMDWIITGSIASIVAEIWNYHVVFWFTMVIIIVILFCLLQIEDV